MRILKYFWIPLTLYFIIAHPATIYCNTHPPYFLQQKDPIVAFVYLGITVICWITVLTYAAVKIYNHTFGIRNGIRRLSKSGLSFEQD